MSAERHPESYCHRCGGPNVSWHAPSPLWNVVMRRHGEDLFDGIVCMGCFAELAQRIGVANHFRLDAPHPRVTLPTTSPDGRIWDPATDLWVEPSSLSAVPGTETENEKSGSPAVGRDVR